MNVAWSLVKSGVGLAWPSPEYSFGMSSNEERREKHKRLPMVLIVL
jgi:hypothetical protein